MIDRSPRSTGLGSRPPGPSGRSGSGSGAGVATETLVPGSPFALYENQEWQARWPGLVAGITARGPESDFGLGTASPPTRCLEAHARLAAQLGFGLGVLGRQVHGSRVARLDREPSFSLPEATGPAAAPPGGAEAPSSDARLIVAGRFDGLLTGRSDVLLTVTAADCVPVYLVDAEAGVLGLLHAGWRGTAAGVLERGVEAAVAAGARPVRLYLHLGPAICGSCYEVGPEVPRALGLTPRPRVDLRAVLVDRASRLGLSVRRISRSSWCTRCARDRFHSHRGSSDQAGRMAAYLGRRARAG